MSEVDLDEIRAMRKLFNNGISKNQAADILKIPYITVHRFFEEFKHQRKAALRGDIVELSFIPKLTFQAIVDEANKRKMPVHKLVERLLSFVVRDNLFAAVLDYKEDEKSE